MKKNYSLKFLLFVLIFALFFSSAGCQSPGRPTPTTVSKGIYLVAEFLDVDQGDCQLIFLPDNKILLIDAGDRGSGDEISAYLKTKGINRIDYLVATHPHADHIGGMSDIINDFEIGQIFMPKINKDDIPTTKTYEELLLSIKAKNLKITPAQNNKILFQGKDYKGECLAPQKEKYESLNSYSVVFKLSYGIHSFLFTGDAEKDSEEDMLISGDNLDSDVLKVAHHGSSSSSSSEFLKEVSPTYAVISCGEDNSYSHPHNKTLKALEKEKSVAKIFRTDKDQTIIFKADGKTEEGLSFTTNNPTVVE